MSHVSIRNLLKGNTIKQESNIFHLPVEMQSQYPLQLDTEEAQELQVPLDREDKIYEENKSYCSELKAVAKELKAHIKDLEVKKKESKTDNSDNSLHMDECSSEEEETVSNFTLCMFEYFANYCLRS